MDEHAFLGLTAEYLIAGFCGGYVYSYRMHQNTAREVLGSVLSGGFVANYATLMITLLITKQLGVPTLFVAFCAGLAWNAICHKVLEYASSTKGRPND